MRSLQLVVTVAALLALALAVRNPGPGEVGALGSDDAECWGETAVVIVKTAVGVLAEEGKPAPYQQGWAKHVHFVEGSRTDLMRQRQYRHCHYQADAGGAFARPV